MSSHDELLLIFKRIGDRLELGSKDLQSYLNIMAKKIDIYEKYQKNLQDLADSPYDKSDYLMRLLMENIKVEATMTQTMISQLKTQVSSEFKDQLEKQNDLKKNISQLVNKNAKALQKSMNKNKNEKVDLETMQIAAQMQAEDYPNITRLLTEFELHRYLAEHKHNLVFADLAFKMASAEVESYRKLSQKVNEFDPKDKASRSLQRLIDPSLTDEDVDNDDAFVVAIADYRSEQPTDLSFQRGDKIHVLAQHTTGWWEGELNGKRGFFPKTFVTQKERNPQPKSEHIDAYFVVTKDYKPKLKTEIEILSGDLVYVEFILRGRCSGRNSRTGQKGSFPESLIH